MTEGSLFLPENGRWTPTDLARGPWNPDALHGGPVSALVARAVEQCEPNARLHVARLSLDLIRPVPVAPLDVTCRVVRPGRRVQVIDAKVSAGGTEVAWGRALRLRVLDPGSEAALELLERDRTTVLPDSSRPPPGPDEGRTTPPIARGYVGFHNGGAELRFAKGEFAKRGPATVWVRLAVPVVPGEEPSPLQRVAGAADFGNGVSSVLDFTRWTFINPDVTMFLTRPAVGEWICLDASTQLGIPGVGVAHCDLWDGQGRLGHSVQSLLVEPR